MSITTFRHHALFWLIYFSAATLIVLNVRPIAHWTYFAALLTLLIPDMIQVYLHLYVLIPKLLFRNKHVLYFSILLISITLHSVLFIWLHAVYYKAGETGFNYRTELNIANLAVQGLNVLSLLGLTTGLKFIKDWMAQQQRWQAKEKQHIQTELSFLRSQIHPHFFFNTLNNLYALTIRQSEEAPEVVLKLSGLMSYMLYESAAETVPLDKELTNLENYMALEKLRFGKRLTIGFQTKGDIATIDIPPLLLLAFVENGFKHGLKNRMGPVRIDMNLETDARSLRFSMSNPATLPPEAMTERGARELPDVSNGIGLNNVRRRLDLIYGNSYRLEIKEADDIFTINLQIPLS